MNTTNLILNMLIEIQKLRLYVKKMDMDILNKHQMLTLEEEDVLNVRIQKLQVNLQSQQMISLNRQKRYIQKKNMDTKRLNM